MTPSPPADGSLRLAGADSGYVVVSATGDPRVVVIQAFGTGAANLLGTYSQVARELLDLDTLAVTEGEFVLSAASGETISATYTGRGAASEAAGVLTFEVWGPVTHGTGRFAHLAGYVTLTGVADLATGEFRETLSGTLARARRCGDRTGAAFAEPLQRRGMLMGSEKKEGQ